MSNSRVRRGHAILSLAAFVAVGALAPGAAQASALSGREGPMGEPASALPKPDATLTRTGSAQVLKTLETHVSTSGLTQYSCNVTPLLRFPEVKGWQASEVWITNSAGAEERTFVSPPYDDAMQGLPPLPAGTHQEVGGWFLLTGVDPSIPQQCEAAYAERAAKYAAPTTRVVYQRTPECGQLADSMRQYKKARKDRLKGAKHADNKAVKKQFLKEAKFYAKRLKKAKKKFAKKC